VLKYGLLNEFFVVVVVVVVVAAAAYTGWCKKTRPAYLIANILKTPSSMTELRGNW